MALSEEEAAWIKMHTNFNKQEKPTSRFINGFEHRDAVKTFNSLLHNLIAHYSLALANLNDENQTEGYRDHCKARIKELQDLNCNHNVWKEVEAMQSNIAKYSTLYKHLQSIDATRNNKKYRTMQQNPKITEEVDILTGATYYMQQDSDTPFKAELDSYAALALYMLIKAHQPSRLEEMKANQTIVPFLNKLALDYHDRMDIHISNGWHFTDAQEVEWWNLTIRAGIEVVLPLKTLPEFPPAK
jgi:hypothetical protein